MVKIWQLTRGRARRRGRGYDLVILDAPATGHALGMLGSPRTFGAIARVGPIAGQTRQSRSCLDDPPRRAYVAVALGTEMAVTEAIELQDGLGAQLGRSLSAVIVNGLLPRRFTRGARAYRCAGREGQRALTQAAARRGPRGARARAPSAQPGGATAPADDFR